MCITAYVYICIYTIVFCERCDMSLMAPFWLKFQVFGSEHNALARNAWARPAWRKARLPRVHLQFLRGEERAQDQTPDRWQSRQSRACSAIGGNMDCTQQRWSIHCFTHCFRNTCADACGTRAR